MIVILSSSLPQITGYESSEFGRVRNDRGCKSTGYRWAYQGSNQVNYGTSRLNFGGYETTVGTNRMDTSGWRNGSKWPKYRKSVR